MLLHVPLAVGVGLRNGNHGGAGTVLLEDLQQKKERKRERKRERKKERS